MAGMKDIKGKKMIISAGLGTHSIKIRLNNKITRQAIANETGVSKKTIERYMKEINNLKYIGSGNNGYWELKE